MQVTFVRLAFQPMAVVANCRNYRANEDKVQLFGACFAHQGQVFADLYSQDGTFHRTAVVAECRGLERARQYAAEANKNVDRLS